MGCCRSKGAADKDGNNRPNNNSSSNFGGPKKKLSKSKDDGRYTEPQSIFDALNYKVGDYHPVRLVRLSYIIKGESNNNRVLGRRQDLPPRAFIDADELKKIWVAGGHGGGDHVLPVFSISCGWERPEHPDPQGMHLALVRKALKRTRKDLQTPRGQFQGFSEVGVFWDWVSLLQGDMEKFKADRTAALEAGKTDQEALDKAWSSCRTKGEEAAYRHALQETMDLWYGHSGVTVCSANGNLAPEGEQRPEEEEEEGRHWFGNSGWVTFELCASRIVPRRRKEVTWPSVLDFGRQTMAAARPSAIEDGRSSEGLASEGLASVSGAERRRRLSVNSAASSASMSSIGGLSSAAGSVAMGSARPDYGRRSSRLSQSSAGSSEHVSDLDHWNAAQVLSSPWPISAAVLDQLTAHKRFAYGPDRATVQALYHRLAAATAGAAEVLDFSQMQVPNQHDCRGFGQYLRECVSAQELNLERAGLTGRSVAAIVEGLILEGGAEAESGIPEGSPPKASPPKASPREDYKASPREDNKASPRGSSNRPALLRELKVLRLAHNKHMHQAGVEALQSAFEGGAMPFLQVLNLNHCSLHRKGAQALVRLFPYLSHLQELVVEANHLEDTGTYVIVDEVKSLPMLKILALGANHIGDEGAHALSRKAMKPEFPQLSRLDLHFNQIADAGAKHLAAAVEAGKLPTIIDLEGNWLEDRGTHALEKVGVEVEHQRDRHVGSKEASDRRDSRITKKK